MERRTCESAIFLLDDYNIDSTRECGRIDGIPGLGDTVPQASNVLHRVPIVWHSCLRMPKVVETAGSGYEVHMIGLPDLMTDDVKGLEQDLRNRQRRMPIIVQKEGRYLRQVTCPDISD